MSFCDVLCDLVPLVQFKKNWKAPMEDSFMGVFTFFILYKWCQIAKCITYIQRRNFLHNWEINQLELTCGIWPTFIRRAVASLLYFLRWDISPVYRWKKCASRGKSMKLCMEIVHDIRSKKSFRPTGWFFYLGILQTEVGLHRKKIFSFFFKSINFIYC